MNKYAVFLRAVNVGGNAVIKMAALKEMFLTLGFKDVSTYIQSGNIILASPSKSTDSIRKKIETLLVDKFNYAIKAFVRTPDEINSIINNNPFSDSKLGKNLVLYLSFIEKQPAPEITKELYTFNSDYETFRIINSEVYALINKDAPKVLFSGNWLEKKIKMSATGRNWNTLLKMQVLLQNGK